MECNFPTLRCVVIPKREDVDPIDVVIALDGCASRREAKEMIRAKSVRVLIELSPRDEKVLSLDHPAWLDDGESVWLHRRRSGWAGCLTAGDVDGPACKIRAR